MQLEQFKQLVIIKLSSLTSLNNQINQFNAQQMNAAEQFNVQLL